MSKKLYIDAIYNLALNQNKKITKKFAGEIVDVFLKQTANALKTAGTVVLPGVGRIKTRESTRTKFYNFKTKATETRPTKKRVKIEVSKKLLNEINQKH